MAVESIDLTLVFTPFLAILEFTVRDEASRLRICGCGVMPMYRASLMSIESILRSEGSLTCWSHLKRR